MKYAVTWSANADADLEHLFDFLLERELDRAGGDLEHPQSAIDAISASASMLRDFPFTCRKAKDSTFLRELVIPFGHSGYIALFEIISNEQVIVAAIRHQREDDYH